MELIVLLSVVTGIALVVAIWGIVQLRKDAKTAH